MKNILLIDINDRAGTFGLRCISSSLKRGGYRTAMVFFSSEFIQDVRGVPEAKLKSLESIVLRFQPDLVGLSITSSLGHALAAAISERIKKVRPVPLVWGGVHPSLMPEFCLTRACPDYVCIGEGEESMRELCDRLAVGSPAAAIPGIMARQDPLYIRRNPPKNLDALPFQDFSADNKFSILPDGTIVEGEPMFKERYVTRCSRGCFFSCSYCCNATLRDLYDPGRYCRLRSAPHVIDEIRQYLALNPSCSRIWFSDDSFPMDRLWVERFAVLYKEQVGVPFYVWFHPKLVQEANVKRLKAAGLRMAMVGIESAADSTRREIFRRPETIADILAADRILTKYKIEKHFDFIVDHPWETRDEMEDNFNLLSRLERPYEINMHTLILLPNTALAKKAVQEGITTESEVIGHVVDHSYEASRKIQWIRGIPVQTSGAKSYWLFFISCLGNPALPLPLIRFLQRRKMFRAHPEFLTDLKVTDMGRAGRSISGYRIYLVQRSRLLRNFSNRMVVPKKVMKGALDFILKKFQLAAFLVYLVLRIGAKAPGILLKKNRRRT